MSKEKSTAIKSENKKEETTGKEMVESAKQPKPDAKDKMIQNLFNIIQEKETQIVIQRLRFMEMEEASKTKTMSNSDNNSRAEEVGQK